MVAVFTPKRKLIGRNGVGNHRKSGISPTFVFAGLFVGIGILYVSVVAWFSVSSSSPLHQKLPLPSYHNTQRMLPHRSGQTNLDANKVESKGFEKLKEQLKINPRKPIVKNFKPKPKGDGIKPQALLADTESKAKPESEANEIHPDPDHIMTAYVEPIKFDDWEVKPLPIRTTATKDQLEKIPFSKVNACSRLPERWPADEYPDKDTFLPWIHDVFPVDTEEGIFIQVVAQNRRRCHTGTTESELKILFETQPSVALFQHVPVKRIKDGSETRYRLSSHEEADPDGVATRFICRFKPTMEETLSVFNFDYDWAAHRKKQKKTFKFEDGGIKSIHTSQLIFRCPVPPGLQDKIRSGETIRNDFATLFLDLIPIRTPPRYGPPSAFPQPRYNETLTANIEDRFDVQKEWGDNHVLPKIEDSGRWENIPICKTSLQQFYGDDASGGKSVALAGSPPPKKHRLVSCIWASAGYSTRGNRFAINDGQRRLLEWVHFNKLLGFEHFYLYDNSYAFSSETTLKPIADLFPDEITYIKWPFQVCNNNPNNVDSPGERSSQYAAESSCRLRFGPHVEWIGQFDIDEYLVPMGDYTSVLPLLDKLDSEGKKIVSFGSWRAWPRRDFIAEPQPIQGEDCGKGSRKGFRCFELQVPNEKLMLQAYNCDRQSGPKKKVMPAEKQIYKPEYVKQHFIHYSAVTALSELSPSEFKAAGYDWTKTRAFPDPNSRFGDELSEATMLHTKAVARQDTLDWEHACLDQYDGGLMCRIGVPFPLEYDEKVHGTGDEKGWAYNCYPNQKIEKYWAPKLRNAIDEKHGKIFQQQ